MNTLKQAIQRRSILFGALMVWAFWLVLMINGNHWSLFMEKWYMTITMVFGSFIAGATSEGGGAVAFPVMTLLFKIDPAVARDFSLMIQAVGMMAAAFTIMCMRIPVVVPAIIFAGLGGAVGITFGLDVVSPLLPPAFTKILFTSVWLSFAAALYWINRVPGRELFQRLPQFGPSQAIVLFLVGTVGGMISGITGSGLDILTFSVLVLGLKIDERVATPTSVVLMGMNALFGFLWKGGIGAGMPTAAWEYWYVCVPVVVLGAPLGAWFISKRSRQLVVNFLYVSIFVQYIAALIILPHSTELALFSAVIVLAGVLGFRMMTVYGDRFNMRIPKKIKQQAAKIPSRIENIVVD